jgi:hypothetical protein
VQRFFLWYIERIPVQKDNRRTNGQKDSNFMISDFQNFLAKFKSLEISKKKVFLSIFHVNSGETTGKKINAEKKI